MVSQGTSFSVTALPGFPLVGAGDDVTALILDGLARAEMLLTDGDVVVVSSKILSKAAGRVVVLTDVEPSDAAHHYAQITGKDPRMVEVVLRESVRVSRAARGVLVTEHRLGFVCANAGVDQSNLQDGEACALLLPDNPDADAARLRDGLAAATGAGIGVVVSDTHGRPFRMGNIGVALGVAGLPGIIDLRGERDLYGRELKISIVGYADLVASAAHLATGEGAEGRPVVVVRGLGYPAVDGRGADLNRDAANDLYR